MFNKTNLKLGLVQGFYWMASCVFVSFLVRLLNGYGYGDYQIGVALTFSSIASLVIQPMVGRLADRVKSVKRLLITCLLIAIASSVALDALHRHALVVYLLVLVIFGSFRSLVYIIDLWSLAVAKDRQEFSYGFTRSFGAVFYAISAVVYGGAIDRFGVQIIVPCFVLCSGLAMVMVLQVKLPEAEKTMGISQESLPLSQAVRILISNRSYVVLLISYTLIEMSSVAQQNYLTRKFELLGSGDLYTGVSLLLMGLLQLFPLLLNTRITRRLTPSILMFVCLFGLALRTVILGFAKTPIGTVLAYLVEPFSFGLYIGSILYYMNRILDPKVRYLGMTFYAAITSGVGGMIGNYVAGYLSEVFGVLVMMRQLTLPALLGFAFYCCLYPRGKKNDILKSHT